MTIRTCLSLLLAALLAAAAPVHGNEQASLPPLPKNKAGMPQPLLKPVHLRVCIFDPMGPEGKIISTARELALLIRRMARKEPYYTFFGM